MNLRSEHKKRVALFKHLKNEGYKDLDPMILIDIYDFNEAWDKGQELPIHSVSKSFNCELCDDSGVMVTGMNCVCDKAPKK